MEHASGAEQGRGSGESTAFLENARLRRERREAERRFRDAQRSKIVASDRRESLVAVSITEDDDEDEEEEDETEASEEKALDSVRPLKAISASAPVDNVESRRPPSVPVLRISRSELNIPFDDQQSGGPERAEDSLGDQKSRTVSARNRSNSRSGESGGSLTRKHPLVRSLSLRARKASELVVTDTDFSSQSLHSWASPRQQVVSPRKEKVSPRIRMPWQTTPRGSSDAAVQGWVLLLSPSLKWKKMFGVVRGGQLELYKREWSGGAGGAPQRSVPLEGSVVRMDADKVVAGKKFVVEVSTAEGPVVLCVDSRAEVRRWGLVLQGEAVKTRGPSAFPGIRMHEVREEEPDETWRELVVEEDGWRVELSSTPVDLTFGGTDAERTQVEQLFQEPSSCWVGVERGEVFMALVAHSEDMSRLLVRTGRQDRLVECLPVRQDSRLLRLLDASEVHPVMGADKDRLGELDGIGAQDMAEYERFKFGVVSVRADGTETALWEEQQLSKELQEFLDALGSKVELCEYSGYAGGLDTSAAARDGRWLVTTEKENRQLAFHVAAWLPPASRKRHIANDYCVVVFLEGSAPFRPRRIRTKVTHMYLVVRKDGPASLATGQTVYKVACVVRDGMPTVAPRLIRCPLYEKNRAFVDFLCTKLLNGERGARFAPDFLKQRTDMRTWWLEKMLADCRKE